MSRTSSVRRCGADDSIVFTKQSLIAYLKTQGVEVGPNCTEFSRLPRYATFGKITESSQPVAATPQAPSASTKDEPARSAPAPVDGISGSTDVRDVDGNAFRPTRRVREAVGGGSAQISALFGSEEESVDSASSRSRPSDTAAAVAAEPARPQALSASTQQQRQASNTSSSNAFVPSTGVKDAEGNDFRPTRRVREPIGGGSQQIASLFGGGDDDSENYAPRRSATQTSTEAATPTALKKQRGAFIVIEGLDRAGKSTQVARLEAALKEMASGSGGSGGSGEPVIMKFPDRTTPVGKILNSYLSNPSTDLDDRAVHLLFAANRWEVAKKIETAVHEEGRVVVADRYAWSGVAYSRAKGLPLKWLLAPEVGLPAPDITLFLSLSPEIAAQRGGYGEERYEKEDVQRKVRGAFAEVQEMVLAADTATARLPSWKRIDAGRTQDEVFQDVWRAVAEAIAAGRGSDWPLSRLHFS
ncbi:unnamed protein product [Parajaminaea phylloscopi]